MYVGCVGGVNNGEVVLLGRKTNLFSNLLRVGAFVDNVLDVVQVAVKKLETHKDRVSQIAQIDHVQTVLAAVVIACAHHVGATCFLVCDGVGFTGLASFKNDVPPCMLTIA